MLVLALGGSVSPIAPRQVTLEGLFPSQENGLSTRAGDPVRRYFLLYFLNTMDRCILKFYIIHMKHDILKPLFICKNDDQLKDQYHLNSI